MIKFTAQTPAGPLFGLGLSRGNVDRLTAGQPIKVNLADLGGPAAHVLILFGETERALFDDLKAGGLIDADVEYRPAEPGETNVIRISRKETP